MIREPSLKLSLMPLVVDCKSDDVSACKDHQSRSIINTHQLCSTSWKLQQLQWSRASTLGRWPD